MTVLFPFGTSVVLRRRQNDGTYAVAVLVPGCAVAPREQAEQPIPSWPPLTSGRTVYAPVGTVVSARDQVVIDGTSYEVDGDSAVWGSPFTGTQFGVVILLRRTDNWFDTTVDVQTYLGASGFGPSWAPLTSWPANIVAVSALNASGVGDDFDSQVQVRVPPSFGGANAVAVFAVGSKLTVAGALSVVSSVRPFTRDGFTEFVEVVAK